MKEHELSDNLKEILIANNCDEDLVLIKNDTDSVLKYSIINKKTFMYLLIEDDDIAGELIAYLIKKNTLVFENIIEIEQKFEKKREQPLFWPKDKPWPPPEKNEH